MSTRVWAPLALLVAGVVASPAAAQSDPCAGDAGAQLVPNVCRLGEAGRHLERALAAGPRACAALPGHPARALACGPVAGSARCDASSARAVRAWASAWAEAAAETTRAWEGRPLLHVDVLIVARAVRELVNAWGGTCGAAPDPAPAWAPYVELVEATGEESLCTNLEELVGPTWSGSRSRWVLNPLRPRLATHCPRARESPGPTFARADRSHEIAEQMLGILEQLERPTVVDVRPVADPSLRPASCARVPFFLGAAAGSQLAAVCGAAPSWTPPTLACEGATPAARAACGVYASVQTGAHGRSRWAEVPASPTGRALVARILSERVPSAATSATPSLDGLPLRLDARQRRGRSCAQLAEQSDVRLAAPVESLSVTDVRVLLASARCRGTDAGEDRRKAVIELARVREAALHAPAVRRSEQAPALVATAGLLLLSANGHQAAGREMVRPLLADTDAFEQIARVVAGGDEPDASARRAASLIATRALGRLVEVAIDERAFALASNALDAMQAAVLLAPVDEREQTLQAVERALLHVTLQLARGNATAARRASEEARALLESRARRTAGDVRYEHEVRAREIELGLQPTPPELETGCGADFSRRGLLREAAAARGPEERAAVLSALTHVLAVPPVTRGPCLRARGFREAETRAALASADLLLACIDEGDPSCARTGEANARTLGDLLLAAVAALERAVDDRLAEGDVDRTRPLSVLAEEVRAIAARAVTEERRELLREQGASPEALERLAWLAYSTPTCVAYPDVRVQLKWLAGRDVPRCIPLEAPPPTPDTTLAFVRYESRGRLRYARWFRRGDQLAHTDLGPADALTARIDELVRAVSDPDAPWESEAAQLADELLGPARSLPRGATLTVVPDAAIAAIPFEVLTFAVGRDDLQVRHALDVTSLGSQPVIPAGSPVVVVADPQFGPSDGATGLTRLAGTRAEASAICSRFRCEGRRLERAGATEQALFAAVQERVGRYGVVHLATHAVFTGADAVASRTAILLAGIGDELPEPPLFSSSSDGLLEERELAALGIAYTELVVLSACGTSRGEARQGIRGLVRAARLSGARSIMGSLWSVDDSATSAWMALFYERLASGDGAATAARAALRAVREGRPHPYFWAPFVLIEGRSTDSYR